MLPSNPLFTFGDIVLRTTLIYFAVLIALRLTGKREIGQMTVFDLIVLLLLANAVQNAMVGEDTTLTGGLVAAGTLLVINTIIAQVRMHSPRLRHLIEGTPTVLILRGKIIAQNIRHEAIDANTLRAALREHGIATLEEVEMAVLENDGSISVIPRHPDNAPQHIHRQHLKQHGQKP